MEMSSLIESLTVSGQHVLLAAQKLNIQPGVMEHREELITATQNVFLGVVKVLLVSDDASVRKVLGAADQVLEILSELGSSPDLKTLLRSFQSFSEALLVLNSLTVDRAHSLQDPRQKQQLLESLETLKKCISMLHTAMCTTIKHPVSEQAQAAKTYILDKVQNTVNDIIFTLKSESHMGSLGNCGFYIWRKDSVLQLLSNPLELSDRDSGFDSMIRDLVFHCMGVANSSRREFQQIVVGHCKHILKFWSDVKKLAKSDDMEELDDTCTLLEEQIKLLDKAVTTAVLYRVLDTFLTASSMNHELFTILNQANDTSSSTDVNDVLTLVEDFISFTDKIIQVANFVSALAHDAKSLERVETSIACLTRLRERILPLSLELEDNADQTIQKFIENCQKWEEETSQLQDAMSCIINVQEFTSISISEMVIERHGCDTAYREQSTEKFKEHSTNLVCHMKLVMQGARRHLDRSDDPIYRNGLLVLLKQVQSSVNKVNGTVKDMLVGPSLNIEAYSSFSDSVSMAIQDFKVLREGLDGQQHPHLLSPLRERARQPDTLRSPSPVMDICEIINSNDHIVCDSPEVFDSYLHSEPEDEEELEVTAEEEVPRKYVNVDLKLSEVSCEPKMILKPSEFDLLPLLREVVTVTKGKDVTALNQACTGVLELSNCYVQAAKEAVLLVDSVDCQTLESFRAELVSLTPLLVQTAQETAMSLAMRTESIYKLSTQFSDLINNIRKVLLPAAGPWYHSVFNMLLGDRSKMTAPVSQQLSEVITLCGDVVQQLTSSDIKSQSDGQETFGVLHNKLNKAQNNTRYLIDFSSMLEGRRDQLEGLCILWGLSIQILLQSLDKILGTTTAVSQVTLQKQLSALSENSLRIQEAARITSLICKSAYKVKQFIGYQEELKTVTELYLQVADSVDAKPDVMKLAKSEFLKRSLLVKIKAVCSQLNKVNSDYGKALQNLVQMAFTKAKHLKGDEEDSSFEKTAEMLVERIRSGTKSVENSLHFIRDPRSRSNLRSINEHLSFQISDIISRTRLIVETKYICDTLTIEVQIQSWAAKAYFVVEEMCKQDGINQGTKDSIRAALQGQAVSKVHVAIKEVIPEIPQKIKEPLEFTTEAAADVADFGIHRDAPSLTHRSLFLKQESNNWDPEDNKIVQVTRKMADTICYMTQYLKKKGPIPNKEAFVTAAKDVISNCESVTQFISVIANHCLDKQCTIELTLIVEQILTITNQLSIISSVNAVTPCSKSSDEILVKNAQNLLQTVLKGVHAAESACITGLKQPEPNTECAEATALCFQWRRNLEMHRAQQTSNLETDDLGLRKTSAHPEAPSLAPAVSVQDGYK
ncbi:hypothetical protein NL108_002352 [Boleophthalmus pectinirostris]|nr:hypothetical protein NL108_002352 [Boleophthalmus pectinirostris]